MKTSISIISPRRKVGSTHMHQSFYLVFNYGPTRTTKWATPPCTPNNTSLGCWRRNSPTGHNRGEEARNVCNTNCCSRTAALNIFAVVVLGIRTFHSRVLPGSTFHEACVSKTHSACWSWWLVSVVPTKQRRKKKEETQKLNGEHHLFFLLSQPTHNHIPTSPPTHPPPHTKKNYLFFVVQKQIIGNKRSYWTC